MTNVPVAKPLCGELIEKTPREFAAHDATVGEHMGAGDTEADGQGLAVGVRTPANVPVTEPGFRPNGPPLIA